jgi:hypothetical protein
MTIQEDRLRRKLLVFKQNDLPFKAVLLDILNLYIKDFKNLTPEEAIAGMEQKIKNKYLEELKALEVKKIDNQIKLL